MNPDKILMMEYVCPVCGKTFIPPSISMWVYKWRDNLICSWGCVQKLRRGEATIGGYDFRQTGPYKKDTPEIRRIIRLLEDGMSSEDIARKVGVSRQLVCYYRRTRVKKNE